jgi:hypothetical protein
MRNKRAGIHKISGPVYVECAYQLSVCNCICNVPIR